MKKVSGVIKIIFHNQKEYAQKPFFQKCILIY